MNNQIRSTQFDKFSEYNHWFFSTSFTLNDLSTINYICVGKLYENEANNNLIR